MAEEWRVKWRGANGGVTGRVFQSQRAASGYWLPKLAAGTLVSVELREVPGWRRVELDGAGGIAGVVPVCPPAEVGDRERFVGQVDESEDSEAVAWVVEWGSDRSVGFNDEETARTAARILRDRGERAVASVWDGEWLDYRPVRNLEAWLDSQEAMV